MKIWTQILHTAMLGTDKKQFPLQDIEEPFINIAERLDTDASLDKQDKFLHLAALVYNYRQCGRTTFPMEGTEMNISEPETKIYISEKSFQILKDILGEDNYIPLLKYWLKQCSSVERVVMPEIIPDLLSIAVQHRPLRPDIMEVTGKRGEWLCRINPSWQFSTVADQQDLWQTGTMEERKNIIKALRFAEPHLARELLTECWDKENAATKIEFLKQFDGNLNTDDNDWLESLPVEKNTKLRETVLQLQKQLPGSSVVDMYWTVLKKTIMLKKEKALLGMINKINLHIEPPDHFDEILFKTGIDKSSNDKLFNDEEFPVYQMMNFIPPVYWETHLAGIPENIIQLFQKDKQQRKYLPALAQAIVRFRDHRWALAFMQNADLFYLPVFPLLPEKQQEFYCLKYFDQYPDELIQYSSKMGISWGPEFSKRLFRYAAKNPYKYTRLFFNENIQLLPTDIQNALEGSGPPEEHLNAQWTKTSGHILKLHTLKQEIIKAFNE